MNRTKLLAVTCGIGVACLALFAYVGIGLTQPVSAADEGAGALFQHGRSIAQLAAEGHERMGRLLRDLNLTPTQKTEVKQVIGSHKAEGIAQVRAIRDAHQKLEAATEGASPDQAAVRNASAEMAKAIEGAALLHAKVRAEVCAKLTPEQVKKLEGAKADMMKRLDQALDKASEQ